MPLEFLAAPLRRAAMWGGFATAILAILLASIGFFTAALCVWLAQHLGAAAAIGLTGLALLLLALLLALTGNIVLGRMRRRAKARSSSLAGLLALALQLAGTLVRRDPKKALLLSALAGVLVEYLTAGRD